MKQKPSPQPVESRDTMSKRVSRIKANLYSHIHVSLRAMNLIIAGLVILLAAAIVAGIVMGKR